MAFSEALAGWLSRIIYSMRITSANPTHVNQVFANSAEINPADFDKILTDEIKGIINETLDEREIDAFEHRRGSQREAGAQDQAKDVLSLITGSIGSTPQSIVSRLVPLLGPAMLAFMLPEIVKFVVAYLIKPGGPFDVRFRREIQKEQFGFYDRQTQWDTQHGYRNVIIQGVNGFKAEQGSFHASTFRDIKEGTGTGYRLSRIGITDKAYGFKGY